VGVSFHLNAALLGLKPPAATIHGDSDAQTVVRLFDRHDVQHVVPGPPGYVFHLPNGYESGSQIVVDGCWLERFPDGADIRAMLNDRPPSAPFRPVLMRHVIDVARGRVEAQVLSDYVMELPSINPAVRGREHRYVWGVAEPAGRDTAAVMFGIAKVDTERRETLYADYYPLILGEPLFVDPSFGGAFEAKAAGEDQGYLLILAFDPRGPSGVLLILAADTLVEHARVLLPEPVHIGFHGLWEAR
jgi:carotenoid cleavage dioxygenase-like enzyme